MSEREQPRKRWRVGEWSGTRGGYEIDYYSPEGVKVCSFIGRPDSRADKFHLTFTGLGLMGHWEDVPKVREVWFADTERI